MMAAIANTDDQSLEKRQLSMFSPLSGIFKTRSLSVKRWAHPKLKIEEANTLVLKKEPGPQGNQLLSSSIPVISVNRTIQKQETSHLNPCLKNKSSATLVSRSSLSELFTLKKNSLYLKIETEMKNPQKNIETDSSQIFVNRTPFQPVTGNKLENSTFMKSSLLEHQRDPSWPLKIRQKSVEMKRKRGSQILFTRQTEEEEVLSQVSSKQNRSHSKSEVPANLFDLLARRSSLTQSVVSSARNLSPLSSKRKPLADKCAGSLASHRNVTRMHTEEAPSRHRRVASESEVYIESYQKRNNKIAGLLKPVQDSYKCGPSLLINNKPQLMPLGSTTERIMTVNHGSYYEKLREFKRERTSKAIVSIEMNDLKKLVFRKLFTKEDL